MPKRIRFPDSPDRIRQALRSVMDTGYPEQFYRRLAERLAGQRLTADEAAAILIEESEVAAKQHHAIELKTLVEYMPAWVEAIVSSKKARRSIGGALFVAGFVGVLAVKRKRH